MSTSDAGGRRSNAATIGVMLPRDIAIADLVPFGQKAERLGFDEVWVVEDCFYRGGIAQAATVLATTESIAVGIGILPAAPRNVAFTALEVATLAELHPGRSMVGLGHGVAGWMKQIGAWPASPLTLIDEQLSALRRLLAGEEVSVDGRYVKLDAVQLENGIDAPPVFAGVRGPKSLAVSGRRADGTILAEPTTPEYIRAAREQIGVGREHRVVAYNFAAIGDDPAAAREVVRPALLYVGDPENAAHVAPLAYAEEIAALRTRGSAEEFVAALPNEWIDDLALVGSVERVRGRIDDLVEAGADSVVLIPSGPDPLAALDTLAGVIR